MIEETKESLSALLDGELDGQEADRLLALTRESEELRRLWGRYHLVGDLLRGEKVLVEASSLADLVQARLRDEPPIIAAPREAGEPKQAGPAAAVSPIAKPRPAARPLPSQWRRMATGTALAASVAALALFLSPLLIQSQAPAPVALAARPAAPPATVVAADADGNRWKVLAATPSGGVPSEVESRLNGYLVQHSDYASLSGVGGVLPYTTFVSYDRKR